jgi:hypothetical protein
MYMCSIWTVADRNTITSAKGQDNIHYMCEIVVLFYVLQI